MNISHAHVCYLKIYCTPVFSLVHFPFQKCLWDFPSLGIILFSVQCHSPVTKTHELLNGKHNIAGKICPGQLPAREPGFHFLSISTQSFSRKPMMGLRVNYLSDGFLIGRWFWESGWRWPIFCTCVRQVKLQSRGPVVKDNTLTCTDTCSSDTPFPELKRSVSFEIFMSLKVKVIPFWRFTLHDDENWHLKQWNQFPRQRVNTQRCILSATREVKEMYISGPEREIFNRF